jgi:hypothetical protein
MADALDELIVDTKARPDLDLLANILKDNIQLTTDGNLNFSEDFHKYPDWKKVMLYMLGRKAIVIKKLSKEIKEESMPAEIGKYILVSGDTVGKRIARELKRIVVKNKGGYFIPNYNLLKCKELLEKKGSK